MTTHHITQNALEIHYFQNGRGISALLPGGVSYDVGDLVEVDGDWFEVFQVRYHRDGNCRLQAKWYRG